MNAEDVRKCLRLFHVQSPWVTIEKLTQRAGVAISDPNTVLVGLLRERNICAHESTYQVSNLWIRAVPHQLQVIGMGIDIAISVAAHEMYIGRREFFNDNNWMSPERIKFRFVDQRASKWAEILEGRSRAFHVSTDKELLLRDTIQSARGKHQVVVVRDGNRQVMNWIYPELP